MVVRLEFAANNFALIDSHYISYSVTVRINHFKLTPTKNAKNLCRLNNQPCFFYGFSNDSINGILIRLDASARCYPAFSISVLCEKNTVAFVKDNCCDRWQD